MLWTERYSDSYVKGCMLWKASAGRVKKKRGVLSLCDNKLCEGRGTYSDMDTTNP